MLHFPDPFFIHVLLGFLMATIVGSTGWGVVGRCIGIKNPDIKKMHFLTYPPRSLSHECPGELHCQWMWISAERSLL